MAQARKSSPVIDRRSNHCAIRHQPSSSIDENGRLCNECLIFQCKSGKQKEHRLSKQSDKYKIYRNYCQLRTLAANV